MAKDTTTTDVMKGTVLVTGGARRLGKTIAATLRACGWNVIAASRTSSDAAFAVDLAEPDGPARLGARHAERTAIDDVHDRTAAG